MEGVWCESSVSAVFLGDVVSRGIMLDGIFEKRPLELLETEIFPRLPRDSIALDVGANIGNHCRFFVPHFSKVIAFEPHPMTATALKANTIRETNDGRVRIFAVGLSDTSGKVDFCFDRSNIGASRIVSSGNESSTQVEVTTLDSLIDDLDPSKVSFIKIDVEGHESKVIGGAIDFLSKSDAIVATEGWYKTYPHIGQHVESLLSSLGYKHFYIPAEQRFKNKFLNRITRPIRRYEPLHLDKISSFVGKDFDMVICSKLDLNKMPILRHEES